MKKKILFIVISVFFVLSATIFMAVRAYRASFETFSKAGYILSVEKENTNSKSVKYYFNGETNYKSNYENNVLFEDTTGEQVLVPEASFIHYNDESISLLKKGVIFNLDEINSKVPKYYNVFKDTILEYSNGTYFVDNLGKKLKFKNFIVKISDTKYMIVSDDIKLNLSDSEQKTISSYLEIDFIEGDVVRLSNQEATYQTISKNASINIGNDIKLSLDNKYFFYKDQASINLESIIIDSDDNIDIKPLETGKGDTIESEDNDADESNASSGGDASTDNSSEVNTDGSVGGNDVSGSSGVETEVDDNALSLPSVLVNDLTITSTKIEASLSIVDSDSLIQSSSLTKIVENSTGKVVYTKQVEHGIYNIEISCDGLFPETTYNLITTVDYEKNGVTYTIDILQQVLVTDSLGVNIEKNYYTSSELSYKLSVDDFANVEQAVVQLFTTDGTGEPIEKVVNFGGSKEQIVTFDNLDSDTKYIVKVNNIHYEGDYGTANGEIEISAKTLKTAPKLGGVSFIIDKRNSSFNLKLDNVTDIDKGIESYRYEIYQVGNSTPVMVIDKNSANSLDLEVDGKTIKRNTGYRFKVVVEFYDNEKYVEYETGYSNTMKLDGVKPPSVSWKPGNITYEQINGTIIVSDPGYTINRNAKMYVMYKNSVGNIEYFEDINITVSADNNQEFGIPISVNNLRANESYTFTLIAEVDLQDNNPVISEYTVGGVVVKTGIPNAMSAASAPSGDLSKAFSASVSLSSATEDASFEASTLSELVFRLYDSSNLNTPIATVSKYDGNPNPYVSELSDIYFDNPFIIDPDFFTGLSSDKLTAKSYTVEIAAAYDYTVFKNQIPIENSTFTIAGYKAPTIKFEDPLSTEYIMNRQLGEDAHPDLEPNTYVGVKVRPKFSPEEDGAVQVVYKIYDVTTGSDNLISIDENNMSHDGNCSIEGDSIVCNLKDGDTPSFDYLTLWFANGSNPEDDITDDSLARGNKYRIELDIKYRDSEGNYYFYSDLSPDHKVPFSVLSLDKQEPVVKMYPSTSTNDEMTVKYIISDVDHALVDNKFYANINGENRSSSEITVSNYDNDNSYSTAIFTGLSPGYLEICSNVSLLNTNNPEDIINPTYIYQYFEGVYSISDSAKLSYSISDKDSDGSPLNQYVITLNIDENVRKRIAALKITFSEIGGSAKFDKIYADFSDNVISIDKRELIESKLLGKEMSLDVIAYYDTGITGYDLGNTYFAFQPIKTDDSQPFSYYTQGDISDGLLLVPEMAMGSFYEKKNNGTTVELTNKVSSKGSIKISNITASGYNYSGQTVLVKELGTKSIENSGDEKTFIFTSVNPGVDLLDEEENVQIFPALSYVDVNVSIYQDLGATIEDNLVTVNMYVYNKTTGNYELNEDLTYTFTDNRSINKIKIENLEPGTKYAMEFVATVIDSEGNKAVMALEDINDKDVKMFYFTTKKKVDITDFTAKYVANSYENKYIELQHKISGIDDLSEIYAIKYSFEKLDGSQGKYVHTVTDNIDFDMKTDIACNPSVNNFFEFGKKYSVKIIPVVKVGSNEVELQSVEASFGLDPLKEPSIAIEAEVGNVSNGKGKLYFKVGIHDLHRVMPSDDYTVEIVSIVNDIETLVYNNLSGKVSEVGAMFPYSRDDTEYEGVPVNQLYKIIVTYKVDMNNTGAETAKTVSTTYQTDALITTTDTGEIFYSGDITLQVPEAEVNQFRLNIRNSYNLSLVNKLNYVILDKTTNSTYNGTIDGYGSSLNFVYDNVNKSHTLDFTAPEIKMVKGRRYHLELDFFHDTKLLSERSFDFTK